MGPARTRTASSSAATAASTCRSTAARPATTSRTWASARSTRSASTWTIPTTSTAACRTTTRGRARATVRPGRITLEHWVTVGPGDGMYNVVDPTDSRWVYNTRELNQMGRHGSEDRRAHDDRAVRGRRASRGCATTGSRRSRCRRTTRRSSTPARRCSSARSTAATRGKRSAPISRRTIPTKIGRNVPVLHDHVDLGVAAEGRHHLGRHRRRQGAADAEPRRQLDRPHARADARRRAGGSLGQPRVRVAARRRHGVRLEERVPQRRLRAVSLHARPTAARRGRRSAATCRTRRSTSSCRIARSEGSAGRRQRRRRVRVDRRRRARGRSSRPTCPTVAVHDLTIHPRENDLVLGDLRPRVLDRRHHAAAGAVGEDARQAGAPVRHRAPRALRLQHAGHELSPVRRQVSRGAERGPEALIIHHYLKADASSPAKVTVKDFTGKVVRELDGPASRRVSAARRYRSAGTGGRGFGGGGGGGRGRGGAPPTAPLAPSAMHRHGGRRRTGTLTKPARVRETFSSVVHGLSRRLTLRLSKIRKATQRTRSVYLKTKELRPDASL